GQPIVQVGGHLELVAGIAAIEVGHAAGAGGGRHVGRGPAELEDVRAGAQRDLVVVDAGRAAHGDADGVVAGSGVDRRAGDAAQDDSIVASAAVDGHDIEVAVGGGRAQRHIGE